MQVLSLLFSDVAPGQDVEFSQYSAVTPQEQLLRERAARALTGALTTEIGRVAEQTFGVDTFQLTPSLVAPNANSSRLDPAARLTIGKRISNRVYVTYSRSLSSTTSNQIILLEVQSDRPLLVDSVAQRGPHVCARRQGETYVLIISTSGGGRRARRSDD